uniref:Immunoglobulin domain-containing protein n=1 Tax=Electrophorus electricus TaxID=8005 RepID=A0A4W4E4Y2_ELEEL
MIILFILLLNMQVKTSTVNELQVQTVRQGFSVEMKCGQNIVKDRKMHLVWYKMSLGKVPQSIMRTVEDGTKHRFAPAFDNDHFNVSQSEEMFDLIINEVSEDDIGTYFCGTVKANIIEFASGTLLLFEGICVHRFTVLLLFFLWPDSWFSLITCSINGHSRHTNKVEDTDDLNYAALRFAQKPSSSGIPRVKDNSDVYARVRIQ